MPDDRTSDILIAIKEQGERSELMSRDNLKAVTGLGTEIRNFAQSIMAVVSKDSRKNGGNGDWKLLFSVGALIFGLMSPMYFMVQSIHKQSIAHASTAHIDSTLLEAHMERLTKVENELIYARRIKPRPKGP